MLEKSCGAVLFIDDALTILFYDEVKNVLIKADKWLTDQP